MATTLYCRGFTAGAVDDAATTHLGTNSAKLAGGSTSWGNFKLAGTRGALLETASASTVDGPTSGIEFGDGTNADAWLSEPVAADVTISGTVTGNVWANESSMNANAAVNFVVDVVRATDNSIVEIVRSARTTELGTGGRAAANFTATPGAGVTVNKGDRLRVRWFIDDATTNMATGFGATIGFGASSAGVDGDTFVTFTETITFTSDPSGTVLYLTNTASAVSTASVDLEAWTSRGGGVQTAVRNTAAGWTAPLQWTDSGGGTVVDWFTRPLQAFTLGGAAKANIRAAESNAAANASVRVEIARVDNDGTNPSVWGSWCMTSEAAGGISGELTTSEAAYTVYVSGDDLSVSDGQRLRIRVYVDDAPLFALAASQTATLYYAGTSGGASGDTYVTLPQTVTESASGNVTITGVRAAATASGRAGTPRILLPGARAAATPATRTQSPKLSLLGSRAQSTANGRPGTVQLFTSITVTGVRAAATANGRAGTPRITFTGARAPSTASGRAGAFLLAPSRSRASATADGRAGTTRLAFTGSRAAATADGRGGSALLAPSRSRASATAEGRAGAPSSVLPGARAEAIANGRAGTVQVSGGQQDATVTGVRAVATANGRAGTTSIALTGVRAAATAEGRAGTSRIAASGVRAAATANGRAGAVVTGNDVVVIGVRAEAIANGRAGAVQTGANVTVIGVRAAAAATGRAGTPRLAFTGSRAPATADGRAQSPKISPSFSRAAATANGSPGTSRIAFTGARAEAIANGRGGTVSIGGSIVVSGSRAPATASGRAGTPKAAFTGARAPATATTRAQAPRISLGGSRATATANGRAGTLKISSRITGVRAAASANGYAGACRIRFTGARAVATANGRAGTCKLTIGGSRSPVTAYGRAGTVIVHARFDGARAAAIADCRGGSVILAAGVAKQTARTRITVGRAVTILATRNGRTRITAAGSRTKTET